MAPQSRNRFKVALILAFFFFLILLLPESVRGDRRRNSLEEKRVMIGSKPPACRNKCMKCKPCTATVVVPNHKSQDDSYYLLSWKCRCGDKFFQP
ncbi:EPIDERMAL PATTERNING FACTOR-like protein 8 [Vigna unguiculata]|uniref:Epidermal patterning factor-like protein n=1 Tax=Vigna unguiculata TaxID=3917 RepID=A0A4D6NAA4_VIGUN|nr:EPIDERMAL PATTERNING FACTOR-like protein 8 [Vigna unguiculata]QCE08877.1 hypothetical protein DEO72_LG10g95 [Vigna unguiculata]